MCSWEYIFSVGYVSFIKYLPFHTSYVLVIVYLKDFHFLSFVGCFSHTCLCVQFTEKQFLKQN